MKLMPEDILLFQSTKMGYEKEKKNANYRL